MTDDDRPPPVQSEDAGPIERQVEKLFIRVFGELRPPKSKRFHRWFTAFIVFYFGVWLTYVAMVLIREFSGESLSLGTRRGVQVTLDVLFVVVLVMTVVPFILRALYGSRLRAQRGKEDDAKNST